MQRPNSEGGGGVPWAFVFDRDANVRALGDVQRRGLQAASQAVEKLLSSMDHSRTDQAPGTEGPGEPDSDISRLAEFWTELATRGLAEMMRMGQSVPNGFRPFPTDSERPVWVDLDSGSSGSSVELVADPSGSTTKPGEVWVCNRRNKPVGPVGFHSSDLSTPDEITIPASAIRFDPAVIKKLPKRSSRGIVVALSSESRLRPGVYRGIMQATGGPDLVVGIQLTVEDT